MDLCVHKLQMNKSALKVQHASFDLRINLSDINTRKSHFCDLVQ